MNHPFNSLSFNNRIRMLEAQGVYLTMINTFDRVNGEGIRKVLYALPPDNIFCEVWFTLKNHKACVARMVAYGELDRYLNEYEVYY
jgi:hypothetical protein